MLAQPAGRRRNQSVVGQGFAAALAALPFLDIFLFRNSFTFFPGPLGYGPLLCMCMLLPVFIVRYKFPAKILGILGGIILLGSTGAIQGLIPVSDFAKVAGSLVLPYTYYWYLWGFLGRDVLTGFKLYLRGAYAVSIFGLLIFVDSLMNAGLFEMISSFMTIARYPADFGIRLSGTLGEPTYFASTISPAGLFAIVNLFFSDTVVSAKLRESGLKMSTGKSIVILAALFFTYSTIALTGVILSFVFLMVMKRQLKTLIVSTGFVVFVVSVAMTNAEVESRINGLFEISESQNVEEMQADIHGSTLVLYNHANITLENLKRNPVFGSGLGTHSVATRKYSNFKGTSFDQISQMNSPDASSMLLRIASELGMIGIALVSLFLSRNYVIVRSRDPNQTIVKLISSAFLVAIILNLFRQGNFILNGFPFFVFGYYFARKQFNELTRSLEFSQTAFSS